MLKASILKKFILLMLFTGTLTALFSIIDINLLSFQCSASTPEEQYSIATESYRKLKDSSERQQYRHNWLNCIEKFRTVYTDYPSHSLASSGMYRAAELYIGLHKISAIKRDKDDAVDLLNRIIKRYPSSTDRDLAEKLLISISSISSIKSGKQGLQTTKQLNQNQNQAAAEEQEEKKESYKQKTASSEKTTKADPSGSAYITDLKYWTTPDYTRIVVSVSDERRYVYQLLESKPSVKRLQRLYLDIKKSMLGSDLPGSTRINDDLLMQVRAGQHDDDTVRVVVDIKSFDNYKVFSLKDPFRVIIDVWGEKSDKPQAASVSEDSASDTSLEIDNNDSFAVKKSTKQSTKNSSLSAAAPQIEEQEDDNSKLKNSTSKENSAKPEIFDVVSEKDSKNIAELPVKKSLKASTMVLSDATRKMLRASLQKEKDSERQTVKVPPKSSKEKKRSESDDEESDTVFDTDSDSNNPPSYISSKKNSRKAEKGTTRVVQISPGSNVDKIKAYSIAKQLALGVRTIVIDPGHGGRDPGASGHAKGVYEKNVVLSIAKRLSQKIRLRLNCNVVMTRSSDSYLSLEERTAIANTKNADLFISIHCNAANDKNLIGIETYYLNLATDDRAINVAARENATSRKNISDLESILNDLMKNAKINESSRLASVVQSHLYRGMKSKYSKVKNLGVKQAPFYVLLGASMPSVLIETSFLSNPEECRRLTDSSYQNALCDSITDGIARYIRETNPQSL